MRIIYILSILCLLTATATAQQKEYKGKMMVTPLQLEQIGDSLYISIDFDISGVHVDSRRSISLIPILVAPDSSKRLPEVMVKGRANYFTSKRELALMNQAEKQAYNKNAPHTIIKGYKADDNKRVLYRKMIAFEPWMKDAKMDIQEDLCGCGNAPRSLAVANLVNRVQMKKIIEPYLTYTQPAVEVIKKREMVGEAFLDFVVAKIDIRPDYMNNPGELKKITDMVNEVKNDTTITVKGISVEGYASPEGTLQFNQYLSEGRANALVAYLTPRFDYPQDMYSIVFGGENWKGLLEIVNNSQMKYKEQVLTIITDKTIDDEVRKSQLKTLLDGEPYRYMVKEYFPSLRKAICKIDYEVKNFDVDQAKEVVKKCPKNLSLNEMFLIAGTYPTGSQKFIELFETAVRMFPEDETANLNAACAALERKDTTSAEQYLSKVSSRTPAFYNAMGVLLMLKGDYDKAMKLLQSAADAGLESAAKNMKEIHEITETNKVIKKVN